MQNRLKIKKSFKLDFSKIKYRWIECRTQCCILSLLVLFIGAVFLIGWKTHYWLVLLQGKCRVCSLVCYFSCWQHLCADKKAQYLSPTARKHGFYRHVGTLEVVVRERGRKLCHDWKRGMRITLAKYPISIDQVKFPLVQGEYFQTKNQMKLHVYWVDF